MKKLLSLLCITLVLFSLCACNVNKKEASDNVAFTVSNEAVTQEEIEYFTKKIKPEIISKYISEYGAVYSESFWDTEFNGTTPKKELDTMVKKQVTLAKIQLILCREHGIYNDISYQGLYNLALEYNEAHKNTQAVGLTEIPLESFYDYYLDNGIMELKNILGESELKPSEEDIKNTLPEVKQKYSDKTEEEQISIAKDIIVEEKYDEYINDLYSETKNAAP